MFGKRKPDDHPERPKLPPIEAQTEEFVREQFARKRTPAMLVIALETCARAFEAAVNDAEDAARDYCSIFAELDVTVTTQLESIEAQRKELRRLQASLPRVEKPNEDPPDHPRNDPAFQPMPSEVESRGGPGLPIPLRGPRPLSIGSLTLPADKPKPGAG